MPWSNQGGGQGPWGRGTGGGGGQPPNFDEMLRKGQDRFKGIMPGGLGSARGIVILVILALLIWLGSGIYRVQPDELGVQLVFGKMTSVVKPGIQYNWPAPVGTVYKPKVTRINRTEIGTRTLGDSRQQSGRARDVLKESLMLTGDENIIDIKFQVFWKIDTKNEGGVEKFLFNVRNPVQTVKDAAESAMREIIGRTEFLYARTQGRPQIALEAIKLIQQILDDYGAGIEVTNVQVQAAEPPQNVIAAFKDVVDAQQDKDRMINQANAYSNEVVERAEGEFQRIVRAAEAYKEETIARAEGETSRFLAVFQEYKKEKDVTSQRIYLETMREILSNMDKVLIDNSQGGSGVLPYLPLDELGRRGGTAKTAPRTGGEQ